MGDPNSSSTTRLLILALLIMSTLCIVVPGIAILRDNTDAIAAYKPQSPSTPASDVSPQCAPVWLWLVAFETLLCIACGMIGTLMMCGTYSTRTPDLLPTSSVDTSGIMPHAPTLKTALPPALASEADRPFQVAFGTSLLAVLALLISGATVLAQNECAGHASMILYFKFVFWFFIVILPPCLLCGGYGNYMLSRDENANAADVSASFDRLPSSASFSANTAQESKQQGVNIEAPPASASSDLELQLPILVPANPRSIAV